MHNGHVPDVSIGNNCCLRPESHAKESLIFRSRASHDVSIASRVDVHTATLQVRVQILDRRANGYLSRYSGLCISFINCQFSFFAYATLFSTMSSIVVVFLGALQASLAVLLTIGYGAIASRWNLLKASSSRDISKACVRLFLPALLITNVGSELHADTAIRYVPVLSEYPQETSRRSSDTLQYGHLYTHYLLWLWAGYCGGCSHPDFQLGQFQQFASSKNFQIQPPTSLPC